jgi:hypothetical protein
MDLNPFTLALAKYPFNEYFNFFMNNDLKGPISGSWLAGLLL